MNAYDHDCCHAGDGCCEADLLDRALQIHHANAARADSERSEALRQADVDAGIRISVLVQRMIGQELRGAQMIRTGGRVTVEYARMRFALTIDHQDLVFDGFFCSSCDRWITIGRVLPDLKLGLERIGGELATHTRLAHQLIGVSA